MVTRRRKWLEKKGYQSGDVSSVDEGKLDVYTNVFCAGGCSWCYKQHLSSLDLFGYSGSMTPRDGLAPLREKSVAQAVRVSGLHFKPSPSTGHAV